MKNMGKEMLSDLSNESLGVIQRDGGLRRGNGSTLLLREGESSDGGDEDFVLGVAVSQHFLPEGTLKLRGERVPRPEVPQELVHVDGARDQERR